MKVKISSQKLAKLLISMGWTQKQLADNSKVSRATISAAANGRMMRIETASKICNAFGCDIDQLIAD